jgi:flagellar hook-basal body complex protein FliE
MDPIRFNPAGFQETGRIARSDTSSRPSFQETLKAFYEEVNTDLNESSQMSAEFAVGKRQSIHEIMIASEKAGVSFKLLMEIRNKLLDAYQEVMNMSF